MIEILVSANGWIVRPSSFYRDGGYPDAAQVFVFNDADEMGKYVANWGRDQIRQLHVTGQQEV